MALARRPSAQGVVGTQVGWQPSARAPLECDDGLNVGGYGYCTAGCRLGPRCGDGILQASEECDEGDLNGSGTACSSACTASGYCGDGITQVNRSENCDFGESNTGEYGSCHANCVPAPYCGDGVINDTSEFCDYGNLGAMDTQYGGCLSNCQPVPYCGDGRIDLSEEQCDDSNSTSGDGCDSRC